MKPRFSKTVIAPAPVTYFVESSQSNHSPVEPLHHRKIDRFQSVYIYKELNSFENNYMKSHANHIIIPTN